ncbi:hypothetical protein [Glycomyces sp. YM15]|uniref:hypothetical protein n=1 Tax=Glycomyces sp. YM15 TaxID=2800446 RepID=UPI001964FA38|nr:hypothetical protein [Glycomyces sp. YM15]
MSYTTLPEFRLPENSRVGVSHDRSGYLRSARPAHPYHRPRPYPITSDTLQLPLPTGRHRRGERPDPIPAPATREAYEARLREIAFQRFLRKSADLAAVHVSHRKPSLAARIGTAFKRAVHAITRTPRLTSAAR